VIRSRGITYARLRLLSALRHGGPRRLLDLGGELGVTTRNVTGRVDTLERDGLAEPLPHQGPAGHLGPAHPGRGPPGGRAADRAAGRAVGELPEADQRHLLQALESLRAVLARHPGL
jgi:predicted ArsR family transcriptional regulator